ncbi:MAG: CDP-alcohol phosphatidyltransferase family protein [Methanomicrobiaceae archaeon]|nr:CDP-alcohol phosphatidyltransferase family protein [Methanomicrobiaceae archaeon]
MNITALRPYVIERLEPLAGVFIRIGMTPNQISLISLLFGISCAYLFSIQAFLAGSILLFLSGILDLVDGTVARKMDRESQFGAVFDWIVDKYVDGLALLGIGISGMASISLILPVAETADAGVAALAIIGSMMNTFIKPVVYAEVGYSERVQGKINDPLEGVGFFGRPETLLVLIVGGVTGLMWVSILIIALCTNLSAIQRIIYLYRQLS